MALALGSDPVGKLETLFGPAIAPLTAIEPRAL
jgi:hypothetical protein